MTNDDYDEAARLARFREEYDRLTARRAELIADGADPDELVEPVEPPRPADRDPEDDRRELAERFARQDETTAAAENEIAEAYAATDKLAAARLALNAIAAPVADSLPAKLRRLESAAGIPTQFHSGFHGGVIYPAPAAPPPVHRHRWAWAQLNSGGVRRVCYGCGVEA